MNKEFIIPKTELPDGSKVHSYFSVTIENNQITSMKLDEQTTHSERTKVDEMMSKLRSKSGGSKFKKK